MPVISGRKIFAHQESTAVGGQGLPQNVISPALLTDTVSRSHPAPDREQASPDLSFFICKMERPPVSLGMLGTPGPFPSAQPPKSGFSTSD